MNASISVKKMDSAIETQIRKCEERLYAAMLASDVSELDRLIADDLIFVGLTGELATKAIDLGIHRTGAIQFHEFTPKELDTRIWNESFVLALAKVFLSGIYLGNAFSGDHRYMRVWQIISGTVVAMG